MTGGTAVILGTVGPNFAAGMTGGMAFVYDPGETLPRDINADSVIFQRLASRHWESVLKVLIATHVAQTQSSYAAQMLREWDLHVGRFWQVCPKELLSRLAVPLSDETAVETA
jgi:glutamate synthase (NADPH/NADH) large chain